MAVNILAVANQKGGVGKTTTCANLGIGLAKEGKRVLLVDCDPQASLTISLGYSQPDMLPVTLSTVLDKVLDDKPLLPSEGILHHAEGVDLMPASIELSGMEVSLVNAMSREKVLKQYLDSVKQEYDFVLIDCMPSLGMLTVNSLAASDSVLIPVQAQYLPAKGLEQLTSMVRLALRPVCTLPAAFPTHLYSNIAWRRLNGRKGCSITSISLLVGICISATGLALV